MPLPWLPSLFLPLVSAERELLDGEDALVLLTLFTLLFAPLLFFLFFFIFFAVQERMV